MKKLVVPVLAVAAAICLAVSIHFIFVKAPLQYAFTANGRLNGSSLFFNQKIFYFHVAHAFMLFAAVGVAGVMSAVYLKTRNPRWDDVAAASVDVAVVFGAVVLATGSIWAKAAWDVWWNWEPRLTMSLLLWLILVGYSLVRKFAGPSADRVAAAGLPDVDDGGQGADAVAAHEIVSAGEEDVGAGVAFFFSCDDRLVAAGAGEAEQALGAQ
jgi:heme exporter protein C